MDDREKVEKIGFITILVYLNHYLLCLGADRYWFTHTGLGQTPLFAKPLRM